MALPKKTEMIAALNASGIDTSEMQWKELQAAYWQLAKGKKFESPAPIATPAPPPQEKKPEHIPDMFELMKGKKFFIAPEMALTRNQYLKYDEVLSYETPVVREDVSSVAERLSDNNPEVKITGPKIEEWQRKPNIAQSSYPHFNVGITYDPNEDFVPVLKYKGMRAYIWHKQAVGQLDDGTVLYAQGVKDILQESFPEYIDKLTDAANMHKNSALVVLGYKTGVDITRTHAVLNQIKAEQKKLAAAGIV